jgi:hypothetical protein
MAEELKDLRSELAEQLDEAVPDGTALPPASVESTDTPSQESGVEPAPDGAETPAAKPAPAAAAPKADADGRLRGPDGKFVKADGTLEEGQDPARAPAEGVAPPAAATPASEQQGQPTGDPNIPPSTWRPAAKAHWATLPLEVREEFKKREADVAKGFEQVTHKVRFADSVVQEIEPYIAMIQSEGGTPQLAIRQLLATAYRLRIGTPQERGALLRQVAQEYGADLGQQQAGAEPDPQQQWAQYIQQQLSPLQQRIQQYEQEHLTAQQRQEQQKQEEIQGQIEAFQSARNQDGTPKFKYFENVRGLMGSLIEGGNAQSLEQAYDLACNADPEVRAALVTEQSQAANAKRLEEAKRTADEARRANAARMEGTGGVGFSDAGSKSLRDEIASQLETGSQI